MNTILKTAIFVTALLMLGGCAAKRRLPLKNKLFRMRSVPAPSRPTP